MHQFTLDEIASRDNNMTTQLYELMQNPGAYTPRQ